jgi:hypothetical protein
VFSTPDRIPAEAAPNCALGDPLRTRWRDFLCIDEYGEILLMNTDGTRIIRAFPLPFSHTTTQLVVTDNAVYCASQGDGALPDSLMCRIDRRTLTMAVRVFPYQTDSAFVPPQRPDLYAPATWVLGPTLKDALLATSRFPMAISRSMRAATGPTSIPGRCNSAACTCPRNSPLGIDSRADSQGRFSVYPQHVFGVPRLLCGPGFCRWGSVPLVA